MEGFKQPFRLDVLRSSGGLLVYLKDGIISKELKKENISKEIQVIPIELNIRKQKWLLLPITSRQNKIQHYLGPVHMEASQPAYRAGALCRYLPSSLIPIQNLIAVHMSRRAGPLSEISLLWWRDLGRRDENFPI